MMNYVNIIGRLVTTRSEKIEGTEGQRTIITLAVPRDFKNKEGIYETDFIDCTCWDSVAINTHEYCNKGDVIAVKGRLQTRKVDNKNKLEVIAEKVTFLTTKANDEEE